MRFFYNLLTYLLLLPYTVYWTVRAVINRSYRRGFRQRFGFGHPKLDACIWIHAVSVGEVVAATPLIREVLERYSENPLLVTTVTPTGAARVESLFGDRVCHSYIPFESPDAVHRYFAAVNPRVALIIETEIWPNLYHGCGAREIPLVLVSARISPKSVGSYRKLLPLFRETLSHGIVIAAQSQADADRFLSLGANPDRTRVTGNIKFDIELPDDLEKRGRELRESLFPGRRVWIAASTHDGEEHQILQAHRRLLGVYPELLLILVPRHPNRFSAVRDRLRRRNFQVVSRTEGRACDPDTEVFFGDTMGEVTLFYSASDIAFVGGSLVPVGGHNLLEPALLGRPIVTGPHVFNAQEIADKFRNAEACLTVENVDELTDAVGNLLGDRELARRTGRNGLEILEKNRGALRRLLDVVDPLVRGV
ncbi:MAG: lipid IV(A) 3-deoxy-D-manno-octulosonic acid transferase [Woeseiaceae bacterium]